MNGDSWIRRGTWLAVVAVAAFAAIVSYSHIYELGRANGQNGTAARLLPLSVDLLIVASSLVLLHEARRGHKAPGLARSMLILGVVVTVAANAFWRVSWPPLGAFISAWPAVAFVGSAETAIGLVRRSGRRADDADAGVVSTWVPESAQHAAQLAFEASARGGNPLSQNALTTKFGITRTEARQIRSAMNGNG